jgi:hypothetical protein
LYPNLTVNSTVNFEKVGGEGNHTAEDAGEEEWKRIIENLDISCVVDG